MSHNYLLAENITFFYFNIIFYYMCCACLRRSEARRCNIRAGISFSGGSAGVMRCDAGQVDGNEDERVMAIDYSVLRDRIDEQVDMTILHFVL